jgi:hypothetical protein
MAMTSLAIILPVAAALTATPFVINRDVIPPHFGSQPTIQKLYKVDGKIVDSPQLDLAAAENACPNGSQTVRQETREDGNQTYLVWTLRCR